MPITHSTTPDGSFSDAGRAAWTAEHSLPVASEITFTPSGSGAGTETVQDALRRMVFSGQYSSVANYNTARAALTSKAGFFGVDVTHTAGTVATGSVNLEDFQITFTGDSGGASDVMGLRVLHTSNGANAVTQAIAGRFTAQHTGSGAVTTFRGVLGECRLDGGNDLGTAIPLSAGFILTGAGSITTNVQMIRIAAPTITGAGTIPAIDGIRISNLGHAQITNVIAIRIEEQSSAVTGMEGIKSSISAGTGKLNLNIEGTAANYLAGVTGIGATPTSSTGLALGAGTTAVSSLRIPHGDAPTSPVNGDMWTTTAGLYVRVNGSTVGPLS